MRIFSRRTLRIFWEKNRDAGEPLKAWFDEMEKTDWNSINHIKQQFGSVSLVGNDRLVFNIKGIKYRLVAWIFIKKKKLFIRFIGTHVEYNKIDAKNI